MMKARQRLVLAIGNWGDACITRSRSKRVANQHGRQRRPPVHKMRQFTTTRTALAIKSRRLSSEQKKESVIEAYYTSSADEKNLWNKIVSGFATAKGGSLLDEEHSQLSLQDLAPLDEFHSRGKQGTLDLCDLALWDTTHTAAKVLDVGCGLGGTARHLAYHYGLDVTGIDLTAEYIEVGQALTRRVDLGAGKVALRQASALDLPFDDASFDMAWTVHVQMNIADKLLFYHEMARVLKTEGRVVFHDVLRGEAAESPVYPCPWAETADMSFLATRAEMQKIMVQAGFEITKWQDQTDQTVAFAEASAAKLAQRDGQLPPLGIHLLMGNTAMTKMKNHMLNCKSERTAVVMGVLTKLG